MSISQRAFGEARYERCTGRVTTKSLRAHSIAKLSRDESYTSFLVQGLESRRRSFGEALPRRVSLGWDPSARPFERLYELSEIKYPKGVLIL